jgi:hypothetical protein
VILEILLNGVVVDERVVNVDEKDHRMAQRHLRFPAPLSPSLQPQSGTFGFAIARRVVTACPRTRLQVSRMRPQTLFLSC